MVEAEDQGKGGFPQSVTCLAAGQSGNCQELDKLPDPIQPYCPPIGPQLTLVACPECHSERVYRDGLRYNADSSSVQRWLCRDCGFRFSEKPLQKTSKESLNTLGALSINRQICAQIEKAKNLDSASEIKTVAGEKSRLEADVDGLGAQYMAYLEREGYVQETRYPYLIRRLSKLGANLHDPKREASDRPAEN